MLALTASLCFAGAVFLSTELVLNINEKKILPLPADIRPYLIALCVGVAVFLLQEFYYKNIREKTQTSKIQMNPESEPTL